jgi:hypothetical protein
MDFTDNFSKLMGKASILNTLNGSCPVSHAWAAEHGHAITVDDEPAFQVRTRIGPCLVVANFYPDKFMSHRAHFCRDCFGIGGVHAFEGTSKGCRCHSLGLTLSPKLKHTDWSRLRSAQLTMVLVKMTKRGCGEVTSIVASYLCDVDCVRAAGYVKWDSMSEAVKIIILKACAADDLFISQCARLDENAAKTHLSYQLMLDAWEGTPFDGYQICDL